jgi:hypothetical protein
MEGIQKQERERQHPLDAAAGDADEGPEARAHVLRPLDHSHRRTETTHQRVSKNVEHRHGSHRMRGEKIGKTPHESVAVDASAVGRQLEDPSHDPLLLLLPGPGRRRTRGAQAARCSGRRRSLVSLAVPPIERGTQQCDFREVGDEPPAPGRAEQTPESRVKRLFAAGAAGSRSEPRGWECAESR